MKGRWAGAARQAALASGLLLAGCDTASHYYEVQQPFDTPVDWWHALQGGLIAQERPPPPGLEDPYPSLGTVPGRPTPTDATTRRALTARLAGERDRTERLAGQEPIVFPGPPVIPGALPSATNPAPPAVGPPTATVSRAGAPTAPAAPAPAPPEPPPMSARIEAADSPPPAPAPRAPIAPPAPPALQAAASARPPPRSVAAGAPLPSGPVPALPTAPPALPALAGIPADATTLATPRPRPEVDALFVARSAVLRPESEAALKDLAKRRSGGPVAILGGGEARSADPDQQAAALPLAWQRARAIADVLLAAGVPTSAMRIDAAAMGRGGVARLVD